MSLNDPEQPGGVAVPLTQTTAAAAATPLTVPAPLAAEGVPIRFACFVTGTDTEIGKTLISSAILHKLVQQGVRACGMKPIAAGAEERDGELHNDDAAMLRAAATCSCRSRSRRRTCCANRARRTSRPRSKA